MPSWLKAQLLGAVAMLGTVVALIFGAGGYTTDLRNRGDSQANAIAVLQSDMRSADQRMNDLKAEHEKLSSRVDLLNARRDWEATRPAVPVRR